jgi:hypothetical protein
MSIQDNQPLVCLVLILDSMSTRMQASPSRPLQAWIGGAISSPPTSGPSQTQPMRFKQAVALLLVVLHEDQTVRTKEFYPVQLAFIPKYFQ